MQVVVEVPETYVLGMSPETVGQRIKLYAALLMFRTGELSAGAACEFADVDRYSFLEECKRLGIEAVNTTTDELESELTLIAKGRRRAGGR